MQESPSQFLFFISLFNAVLILQKCLQCLEKYYSNFYVHPLNPLENQWFSNIFREYKNLHILQGTQKNSMFLMWYCKVVWKEF